MSDRRFTLDPRRVPAVPVRLNPEHLLARGLVGCWLPGVGLGRDYSPLGNNGALSGAPPIAGGPLGPALSFNGTFQYVTVPDTPALNPSEITVCVWFKTTTATLSLIVDKSDASSPFYGYSTAVNYPSTNGFGFYDGTNWTGGSSVVNDGKWHLGVGLTNGTTAYSFVDGVQTASLSSTPHLTKATPLDFGRRDILAQNYFNGLINGVWVYNRALSVDEIVLQYAEPFGMFEPVGRRTFVDLLASGGGTIYSASISEPIALAETETVAAIFAASDSEAMTLSDSPSVTAIFRPSITEAATLADSPSVTAIFRPSITEAATLADQPSATFVTSASITETMTLADQPSATFVTASSITESMSLSDTVTGGLLLTASITEAASLSDSSSVTAAFAAAMSESMTLADSPAAVFIAAAAISEAMTLADSPSVAAILGVAISEAMALTDMSSAGGQIYTVSISEAMALADTISAAVAFAATAAESLSLTDALSVAAIFSASLTEAMAFTDSATAGAVYPVSITDSISLQDVVSSPAAYIGGTVINILSGRVRVQMISGPTAVRMILARPRN